MSCLKKVSFVFAITALGCVLSAAQEAATQPANDEPSKTMPQVQPAGVTDQPVGNVDEEKPKQHSDDTSPRSSTDQILDRVVEREHAFVAQMRHLHPLVETYIQDMKTDKELGEVPISDHYFLGRLNLTNGPADDSFMAQPGFKSRFLGKLTSFYSMKFLPLGFAQMVLVDTDFQRKYYDFTPVRKEFLGEVRCLVFDVQPKQSAGQGRFLGRIWVEDQNYNIVRFNGTYAPHPKYSYYLHFDSWRLNLQPGVWLPAYIYSQESDLKYRDVQTLHFKAQTRLWGYDLTRAAHNLSLIHI